MLNAIALAMIAFILCKQGGSCRRKPDDGFAALNLDLAPPVDLSEYPAASAHRGFRPTRNGENNKLRVVFVSAPQKMLRRPPNAGFTVPTSEA